MNEATGQLGQTWVIHLRELLKEPICRRLWWQPEHGQLRQTLCDRRRAGSALRFNCQGRSELLL